MKNTEITVVLMFTQIFKFLNKNDANYASKVYLENVIRVLNDYGDQ